MVSNAYDSLMAFRDANTRKSTNTLAANGEHCWIALMAGFVNVNWNAAVDKNKMKMGIRLSDLSSEIAWVR